MDKFWRTSRECPCGATDISWALSTRTEKADADVRDFFGKGNGSCRQDRDDCHLVLSVPSALGTFVHPFTPANASVRTRLRCYKRS